MAIKIVKKRHVPVGRPPAPLIEDTPAQREFQQGAIRDENRGEEPVFSETRPMAPDPSTCWFCGHIYIFPCHGEDGACRNAQWKREHELMEGSRA